ncbi:MAG: YhbY family RNA-binding protein [Candidatus Nezhaarchaeota archaeon]|nr:YhbY family RNA-binding protein [Candidatus Nezhaarchaeota archaeon]MCX8142115.1 YhbY family RNA-binding protein [Candidatus Nezhaarchaeota archaeon]MDW8050104.1 YhbY family RNA-binding protein [Nitrososphaerota archaeon]
MRKGIKKAVKNKMTSRADVNIGKKGLTSSVLNEIDKRLDTNEIVKVRVLKSALAAEGIEDRKQFARILAEKLKASLMEVRGYTVVLYRRRRRKTV